MLASVRDELTLEIAKLIKLSQIFLATILQQTNWIQGRPEMPKGEKSDSKPLFPSLIWYKFALSSILCEFRVNAVSD